MRRLALLTAVACALVAAVVFPSGAATQNPAAPYIASPGVTERFRGGAAIFTARIFCGNWKAIVELTAGINGQRSYTRTIYVCAETKTARVRFVIRRGQLGPDGKYQYRLKVGRHDANGKVVRWTHSLYGNFRFG